MEVYQGITVSPDGKRVYVANGADNTVSVINTASNSVIATIRVGAGPAFLSVAPDSSRVYVADGVAVSVINAATDTVMDTIPVGPGAVGTAVSPDGAFVYVTNGNGNTVSVINTATDKVVGTVPVGSRPIVPGFFTQGSRSGSTVDYTVAGTSMPWEWASGGLNSAFHFGLQDGTAPTVVASDKFNFVAGDTLTVQYLSGGVNSGAARQTSPADANGVTYFPENNGLGSTGTGLPSDYMSPYPINLVELVGTFANSGGAIIGTPFALGDGPTTLTIPSGATELLLGVNDDKFFDNSGSFEVSVSGQSIPNVAPGGTVRGAQATNTPNIALFAQYSASFAAASGGHSGTPATDPQSLPIPTLLAPSHHA